MFEFAKLIGGGIAADVAGEQVKHMLIEDEERQWKDFLRDFPAQWLKLLHAIERLDRAGGHSPIPETINLWGHPSSYQINMRGRGHLSMFCLAQFNLFAQVQQIGIITLAPKAGWNTLDLTDHSELSLPDGTAGPVAVLLLYADTNLGTAVGVA